MNSNQATVVNEMHSYRSGLSALRSFSLVLGFDCILLHSYLLPHAY